MLNTYEKFSMLNNDLIKYLNELITNNFKNLNNEDIIVDLERILTLQYHVKFFLNQLLYLHYLNF